ncbi:hypothetical protein [Qipengyuania sp. JC766]|uniref:hypothetical protein n=1 Tax=Qipengyuania sp. JC766 TaxID=3232139 RepID=UPI003457E576
MVDEAKRDELRAKIEAGERRNADRSFSDALSEAGESIGDVVREHPIATIAGVAVVGVIIGTLLPTRRIADRASSLGSTVAELGAAYGAGLFDAASGAARHGQDRLEDFADAVSDNRRGISREARYRGQRASDSARRLGRDAGKRAGRSLRDARARLGV